MTKTRLNKYIAKAGICSRRKADTLIAEGKIRVNGEVITEMGIEVTENDVVEYKNRRIQPEDYTYILINKPKDFITTTDDPKNRKTVMNLIENATESRVYPVGRLDRNTSGLLLLTNDGTLAKKLTHPSGNIPKLYEAKLDKPADEEVINKISKGVELEDGFVEIDDIAFPDHKDKSRIGIEIHSGKNRVVRRIFEKYGYKVKALDRVLFAKLNKKDLPRGKWRFLNDSEVRLLKNMTKNLTS